MGGRETINVVLVEFILNITDLVVTGLITLLVVYISKSDD